MKPVLCDVKVPEGTMLITKSGERYIVRRAEQETEAGRAFVKSQRYREAAMAAIDPATRELYLTAARQMRKEAGLA